MPQCTIDGDANGGLWSHNAIKRGSGHMRDRIGRCLGYLRTEADPDHTVVSYDHEFYGGI